MPYLINKNTFPNNAGLPAVLIKDSWEITPFYNTKNYERAFQSEKIPGKKPLLWINNPQHYFTKTELNEDDRINSKNINVFINSCSSDYAKLFAEKNFKIYCAAKEAVLKMNLDHFGKKSIKELIRYGKKNGSIKEFDFSLENKIKLEQFKAECAHGKEPQLKYYFNDQFMPGTRLFAFIDHSGKWLGAVLTARNDEKRIRTDLLLRRKDAIKGVMELLIYTIFNKLKSEGAKTWSLGDVPYVVYNSRIFSREFTINFAGRRLRFAYNYLGLYNFKNKFNPVWYDSFICTNSRYPILFLIKIALVSNLIKLIFYRLSNYN